MKALNDLQLVVQRFSSHGRNVQTFSPIRLSFCGITDDLRKMSKSSVLARLRVFIYLSGR